MLVRGFSVQLRWNEGTRVKQRKYGGSGGKKRKRKKIAEKERDSKNAFMKKKEIMRATGVFGEEWVSDRVEEMEERDREKRQLRHKDLQRQETTGVKW